MVDYPDYAARAVRADEQAERSPVPSLVESWRRVAKSYWALARQHTEINIILSLKVMPRTMTLAPEGREPVADAGWLSDVGHGAALFVLPHFRYR